MNYQARTTKIFAFFMDEHTGLLHRYTRPKHLDADQARDEINDLVEDLNSNIPDHTSEADIARLLDALRPALRCRHGSRTWPTTKVLLAALTDVLKEISTKPNNGDAEENALAMLTDWYRKFGDQMPAMGSTARTAALVDRGVMTAREARNANFMLSDDLNEFAKEQPMGHDEWTRHMEIIARLWRVTFTEAVERDGTPEPMRSE
ncbi:hypothetical protein [Parasedimentitalea psychrophila]|uniref:Uncharacterized protein n=1 Tax=Parasedimentitalea psychrophila TaxID=2997337 RepID=A0A9Y2KW51_9RHOB|nr:hypothetical protein [Parasedimentitalea psychrophila]WIY24245.1 hypothetical protein QPJ95_16805 [Parasedimentitalea psychrophila]